MILTKEVEVKPRGKMIQYYRDKGYDAKYNQPLIVNVSDLSKRGCCIKIDVLCDMCKQNTMSVRYVDYYSTINKYGCYVCRDCSFIRQKQHEIEQYGKVFLQTEEFKEKSKRTLLNHYGVENPLQSEEIKAKCSITNMQRYGYTTPLQVPEFKEKSKHTMIERYGVDNASKSEEIKQKLKSTNIKKYGVDNPMKFPKIREKVNETLCKNGNQKTSSQQLYLNNLYGGELNYQIKYYAIDICFLDEKLCIEYDGGGHDLRVVLGRLTKEEFNQKEIIRGNVIKHEGYKQMKIISSKDLLPSDEILLQMLSDAKQYFADYPNHSWFEFDIDNSTVRNAENKDGISYDFGDLRKITQDAA